MNSPPFSIDIDNPSSTPDASTLYKPPRRFNTDGDERQENYKIVLYCLSLRKVVGAHEFFQRVKEDLKNVEDQDWMGNCVICSTPINTEKACFLICTCKRNVYCSTCVRGCREASANKPQVRSDYVECPTCRAQTYFVHMKWVLINDPVKRDIAKRASAKKIKSAKRKRKTEEKKAARLAKLAKLV
ncbi:hypothetical protein L218DRAFT_994467 [Marasmius fiardii PR-910]|nr:hypothetical protein L218DRAFT_994467 [Marasmius fiardii PR-910]